MSEDGPLCLMIGDDRLEGTLLEPRKLIPGVLFIHGWGGDQAHDLERAREIARIGCLCFTFDLRGHAANAPQRKTVTRGQNLEDALAAYDFLASQPIVDKSAIAVVGTSYGGYLAAILSSKRPVNWLALRVPALYRDSEWETPKDALNKADLKAYRRSAIPPGDNQALRACAAFEGDALIVESQHDDVVPHATIAAYRDSLGRTRSLTYRMIEGADHGLSTDRCRRAYNTLLVHWLEELVQAAREVD